MHGDVKRHHEVADVVFFHIVKHTSEQVIHFHIRHVLLHVVEEVAVAGVVVGLHDDFIDARFGFVIVGM